MPPRVYLGTPESEPAGKFASTERSGVSASLPAIGSQGPGFGASTVRKDAPTNGGAYRLDSEIFDPNDIKTVMVIPASEGARLFVECTVLLGSWGSTVYTAYLTTRGALGDTTGKTAVFTLNSGALNAEVDSAVGDIVVVATTAHGSSGSLHQLKVTGMNSLT